MEDRIISIIIVGVVAVLALTTLSTLSNSPTVFNGLTGYAAKESPFNVNEHLVPNYKYNGLVNGFPEYTFWLEPSDKLLEYSKKHDVVITNVLWTFEGLTQNQAPQFSNCNLVPESIKKCTSSEVFYDIKPHEITSRSINNNVYALVDYTIDGKEYTDKFYTYKYGYSQVTPVDYISPYLFSSKTIWSGEVRNHLHIEEFFVSDDLLKHDSMTYQFRIRADQGLHSWLKMNNYDMRIVAINWFVGDGNQVRICGEDIYSLSVDSCVGTFELNPKLLGGMQKVTAEVSYEINGRVRTETVTDYIDLSKRRKAVTFKMY